LTFELEIDVRSLPQTLALLLLFSGCGFSSSTDVVTTGKASPAAAPATTENTTSDSGEESPSKPSDSALSASSGVSLVDDEGAAFNKYLEENKGKVILIDCWATWCAPCKKGFPNTVALHEKYKDQGLVVVSVSFDDMGDDDEEKSQRRNEAVAFLAKQKATFKNFLAKTGVGPESGDPFGVSIKLPVYRIIDKQGKDRFKSEGGNEETEAEISKVIEDLLKEAG
jgi:thiol-disulfide isomerase/thioredoxin